MPKVSWIRVWIALFGLLLMKTDRTWLRRLLHISGCARRVLFMFTKYVAMHVITKPAVHDEQQRLLSRSTETFQILGFIDFCIPFTSPQPVMSSGCFDCTML